MIADKMMGDKIDFCIPLQSRNKESLRNLSMVLRQLGESAVPTLICGVRRFCSSSPLLSQVQRRRRRGRRRVWREPRRRLSWMSRMGYRGVRHDTHGSLRAHSSSLRQDSFQSILHVVPDHFLPMSGQISSCIVGIG